MPAVFKELRPTLALALPIVIGQAGQMLMGITDSMMIGQVGRVPLAAAAFAHTLWVLALLLAIGLLIGVSIFVARAHGAGRPRDCSEYLRHGMAMALGMSVGSIAVLLGLLPWLDRFGQPAEIIAVMKPYFVLITVSLLPALLFQVLRQYSEALGHAWAPMVVLLAGVGLNVVLNWVLIYGHWGAPALGLTGAGWATLISRIVALVGLGLWLTHRPDVRREWPGRAEPGAAANPVWLAPVDWARIREMLVIGVPVAGQLLFEAGAFSIAALMMGWLGTVPLAAHQIALSCASFTFMLPLGISNAISIRIGRASGEGRTAMLRLIGLGGILTCALFMVGTGMLFAFGGGYLAQAFTPDAAVVAMAARLLVVAGVFQLFDGVQIACAGALRGLTDVKVPTLIAFIAYWLISLPLGYGLAFHTALGAVGIWAALAAGLACAAVLLADRFRRLTRSTGQA